MKNIKNFEEKFQSKQVLRILKFIFHYCKGFIPLCTLEVLFIFTLLLNVLITKLYNPFCFLCFSLSRRNLNVTRQKVKRSS